MKIREVNQNIQNRQVSIDTFFFHHFDKNQRRAQFSTNFYFFHFSRFPLELLRVENYVMIVLTLFQETKQFYFLRWLKKKFKKTLKFIDKIHKLPGKSNDFSKVLIVSFMSNAKFLVPLQNQKLLVLRVCVISFSRLCYFYEEFHLLSILLAVPPQLSSLYL